LRAPATIVLRLQLTLIPVTGRQLTATASPRSHPERELRGRVRRGRGEMV